jgi:glutamate racemase
VSEELRRHTGPQVRFIDTGVPVALQTRRLLAADGLLTAGPGSVELQTSGAPEALQAAAARWLLAPAGSTPQALRQAA